MVGNQSKVLVLKDMNRPVIPGEHFRLLCMTGQKKGTSYYLKGQRLIVGRSENADIQVFDHKSSREHAELKRVGKSFVISDLGSHNGVIVNDLKIMQKSLDENDQVIIGQTVFKFERFNVEESKSLDFGNGRPVNEDLPDKKGKKNLVFGLVIILLVFLLLGDGPEEANTKTERRINLDTGLLNSSDDFAKALKKKQESENRELKDKLEIIFQRGLRELRETNYFRAMEEFNLALVHAPNNGTAQFYMEKARGLLNKEIEGNFEAASKERDSLRYRSAIVSYCNITRLLQNYKDDDRYKKADQHIRDLEKTLGLDIDEIKCF